jgi:uncharacterized protein YjiS (DUF1127 family)
MTTITEPKARSQSSSWTSVGVAIGHIMRTLMAWHDRARERRQLLLLSDYALRDIGKSREDVAPTLRPAPCIIGEGDQPYWRARVNWACRLPK